MTIEKDKMQSTRKDEQIRERLIDRHAADTKEMKTLAQQIARVCDDFIDDLEAPYEMYDQVSVMVSDMEQLVRRFDEWFWQIRLMDEKIKWQEQAIKED